MLLEVKNVSYRYNKSSPWILEDVSFTIDSKERVALVGPSGYGKSTLAKIISGYIKPEKGEILWDGKPLPKNVYCPIQMIYQHPEKSVNPRWKMAKILNEAWEVDNNILQEMGIEKSWFNRWPNELSGGELQRFCIARVLGPETKFLVCDEISTMLDVITQAQIWNFLLKTSQENELGMLVVTHNIELANRVCDRIIELPKLNKKEEIAV
ncbi:MULTISPECIES: ABC transporter ATP-binding protein [Clostridium]|uniref:ABC transporter n=1 Tax=Clostridium disporicum TaxID=84024 RepID=A0A174KQN2_9CLOT|nr:MULTISPECIES: ATP-binding cassette domain-containing protein [Clostridium]MCD2501583.1 ATP-binding cassette domain-containing protein [Clostridium sp. NSJ-145]CUP12188.1 ABC transporter [Clostridium disporicum]